MSEGVDAWSRFEPAKQVSVAETKASSAITEHEHNNILHSLLPAVTYIPLDLFLGRYTRSLQLYKNPDTQQLICTSSWTFPTTHTNTRCRRYRREQYELGSSTRRGAPPIDDKHCSGTCQPCHAHSVQRTTCDDSIFALGGSQQPTRYLSYRPLHDITGSLRDKERAEDPKTELGIRRPQWSRRWSGRLRCEDSGCSTRSGQDLISSKQSTVSEVHWDVVGSLQGDWGHLWRKWDKGTVSRPQCYIA